MLNLTKIELHSSWLSRFTRGCRHLALVSLMVSRVSDPCMSSWPQAPWVAKAMTWCQVLDRGLFYSISGFWIHMAYVSPTVFLSLPRVSAALDLSIDPGPKPFLLLGKLVPSSSSPKVSHSSEAWPPSRVAGSYSPLKINSGKTREAARSGFQDLLWGREFNPVGGIKAAWKDGHEPFSLKRRDRGRRDRDMGMWGGKLLGSFGYDAMLFQYLTGCSLI